METGMPLNAPHVRESVPPAMSSQTLSPKLDSTSRSQFPVTAEEEYIQDFMGTALKELENEASLQDSSNHPGMGLLLSLSDKLAPTMDVPGASGPDAVSEPSQRASSTDIGSYNKSMGVSSPVVPSSLATPTPSLFAPPCTPFDHSIHLDTVASVASEAAATQYKEPAEYRSKRLGSLENPTSGPFPSPDLAPFTPSSSNAYLYMLRHTAVKDSNLSVDGHLIGKSQISPPSVALSTPNATARPDMSPASTPAIIDDLTASAQPVQGEAPIVTRDSNLPCALPNASFLDDELKQRQVIEDAVRTLNAHHQLAQTAALQHHESLNLTVPSHSATKAPLLNTATTGQVMADDPSSTLSKCTMGVDGKQNKRAKIGDAKIPESTETLQKRFQCPKCSRAFARAYNLNTHLSTHDPDPSRAKPFPCPYRSCRAEGGRSFSRKHDLQRHVASVHEWEPEPGVHGDTSEVGEGQETGGLASLGLGAPGKKFRCEQCGRGFVRRDALRRHHCERTMTNAVRKTMPNTTNASALPVRPLPSHVSSPMELARGSGGGEPMSSETRLFTRDMVVGQSKSVNTTSAPMERSHATGLATASV